MKKIFVNFFTVILGAFFVLEAFPSAYAQEKDSGELHLRKSR
jgi:hypothetical protein